MTNPRSSLRLLVVGLQGHNLRSPIVAWSLYDPSVNESTMPGCDDHPPYLTPLDALRDGWRLVQYTRMPDPPPGGEMRGGSLACECLFEEDGRHA
jgi:hypothetical protein